MTKVRSPATVAKDAARQRAKRRAARSGAVRILPVRVFTGGQLQDPRRDRRAGYSIRRLGMGRPTLVRVQILPVSVSVGGVHVKTGRSVGRPVAVMRAGSAVPGVGWLDAFNAAVRRHDAARARPHPWVADEDARRRRFAARRRPLVARTGRVRVAGRVAGWSPPSASVRADVPGRPTVTAA